MDRTKVGALIILAAVIALVLYLADKSAKGPYYGPSTGEACDVFVARMRDAYHRRMGLTPAEQDGMECCSDRPDHAGCGVFKSNGERIGVMPH